MGDEFYLSLAIDKAWDCQLLTYPNPAVGAVVLDENGQILSVANHQMAGLPHAELNATKQALEAKDSRLKELFATAKNTNDLYNLIIKNHQNLLKNSTYYVTLEPCAHQGKTPPCANLILAMGAKRVVIGSRDYGEHAKGGAEFLAQNGVEVKLDVCKARCDELLEPFLRWQSGNFTFFKIALTQNGVATGGVISNLASRTHTHHLRALAELMVVGGATVCTDRPTLDARLISGRAPDILIYSSKTEFDLQIPLFNIPNRKVEISNSIESAFKKSFVMIEGGENFLRNLDSRVDWILIYRSNEFKSMRGISLDFRLKIMHKTTLGDGELLWCKRLDLGINA
ncbi:MAG: bifunctional diaminohydroxyphosphoribosylaminopyrimidine deaminase/5-amino-6-(5-phosphoribosylamino)uracil reductase RibD [Campylobacter sp.]|uniref:bifunctional diaminohydroxyphosphoribosylaminopyrimidine deaminase/5-amino-6-(5-phosphoribosylamino)uracil reductase RibD n=1 Tax=Campylobacter sp. TaxID=205 RepID=UPI001B1854CF|nr:bifunctional diaminohydroxyphosphoribosylaminopyrimidine deaminase/5-amino-6-(5-phosphoribosylamino)uracil reductase RibD [Campylobacter sp.]MBO7155100.1 bifunctional diaminohydroxyphosphoribosylaminopyrimidine deaminase/5-amino-6-(5-phosphoribosylamino)uracil reductase RibD [Campylobacter sp.]